MPDSDPPLLDEGLLDGLEAAWAAQGAPIAGRMAPGLTDAEMDEITGPQLRLPVEARRWWGWHNGVPQRPGEAVTPERRMGVGREFLPLQDAVESYREEREIFANVWGDPELMRPKDYMLITRTSDGPVLCDCTVPDGAPSPIHCPHAYEADPEAVRRPAARSFGEMVSWWIEALNDGGWQWDQHAEQWHTDRSRLDPQGKQTGLL